MDKANGSTILSAIQDQQITLPPKDIMEPLMQTAEPGATRHFSDVASTTNGPIRNIQHMEVNGSPLPSQLMEDYDDSGGTSDSCVLVIDQERSDRPTAPSTPNNNDDLVDPELLDEGGDNATSGKWFHVNQLKRKLSQDDSSTIRQPSKYRRNCDENGVPAPEGSGDSKSVPTTTISFNHTIGKLFNEGEGHLKEYAQYLGLQPKVKFKCFKCAESRFESFAELKEHQEICLRTPQQPTTTGLSSPKSIESGSGTAKAGGNSKEDPSAKIRITRKVFLCSTCGTYYEKWNLFLHMREVHKKHICLRCVGLFHSAERLIHHMETKHDLQAHHFETKEDLLRSSRHEFYVMCSRCEHVFLDSDNFTSHHCDKYLQPCSLCGLKLVHKPNCKASVAALKRPGGSTKEKKSKAAKNAAKNKASLGPSSQQNFEQVADQPKSSVAASNGYQEVQMSNFERYSEMLRAEMDSDNNSRSQHSFSEPPQKKSATPVQPPDLSYFEKMAQQSTSAAATMSNTPTEQQNRFNGETTNEKADNSLDELSSNDDEEEDEDDDDDDTEDVEPVMANTQERLLVPKLKLSIPKEYQSTPIESEEDNEEDDDDDEESSSAASSEASDEDDDGAEQSNARNVDMNNSEETQEEQNFNESSGSPDIQQSQAEGDDRNVENTDESMKIKTEPDAGENMEVNVTDNFENSASTLTANNETEAKLTKNENYVSDGQNVDNEKIDDVDEIKDSIDSSIKIENPDQQIKSDDDKENKAAIPSDGISVAGEDVQTLELTLQQPLDKIPIRNIIRTCLAATFPLCLYCNHARRIAVNGKALALHMISQHRFYATVNSITAEELLPCTIVAHLKASLDELEPAYFNLDTYNNADTERDGRPTLGLYESTYECFQCRFGTRIHKELYLHNRKMHLKAVIICLMCRLNFYSYSELLCHICPGVSHTISILDLTFRCVLCDLDEIPSAFRLMVHLRKRHFACDVCLEECHDQAKLSSHVWKHKLQHLCYRCGIAYRNKPDITKHLFWKHGTESVLCKRCLQKKWPHIYHFCVPPPVFICEECNLHFTKAVALKVHKRLHNSNAPYPCTEDDCEKRFISRKLLLKHVARHQTPLLQLKSSATLEEIKEDTKEAADDEEQKVDDNNKVTLNNDEIVENVKKVKKKKSKKNSPENSKSLLEMLDLSAPNLSESDSSDESESESKPTATEPTTSDEIVKKDVEPSTEDDTKKDDNEVNCNGELTTDNDEMMDTSSIEEKPSMANPMLDILKNLQTYQESQNPGMSNNDEIKKESKELLEIKHVVESDHDYAKMCKESGEANIVKDEEDIPALDTAEEQLEIKIDVIANDIVISTVKKKSPPLSQLLPPPSPLPSPTKSPTATISSPDIVCPSDASKPTETAVRNPTTASVPATASASTAVQEEKEDDKVKSKKKESGDSSSSDSSTDSDSTSCSCGSNCSCSSSSSSSSSSSTSSDSDSSSSEGKQRRKKLKLMKQQLKEEKKMKVVVVPEKVVPIPAVPVQENVDPDDVIFESDLETDESLTDEDFYDQHPHKLASELLAEKRKQLLLQTCINPTDNYDIIENSRPSTPSLPEQEFTKEKKVKIKKKKKERKKNHHSNLAQSAITPSPLEQLFQEQQAYDNAKLSTPAPESNTIKLILSDSSHPVIKPTEAITSAHIANINTSSAGSNSDASASASDGALKRSKRRRIPNRFYGYSSDEEGFHHPLVTGAAAFKPIPPPNLTWRKEDLPQPSNTKTPPIKSVIKLPPKSHIPLSPLLPPIPPLVIKPIPPMPEIVPPKVEPLRVPSVPVHHINPSVTPVGSAATSPKSDDSDSSDEGALHILPPPPVVQKTPKQRKKRRSTMNKQTTPTVSAHRPAGSNAAPTAAVPTLPAVATLAQIHQPAPAPAPPVQPMPRLNPLIASSYFAPAGSIRAPPQVSQPPYGANPTGLPRMPASFANRPRGEGKSVYCYCRCPYDEVSDMIACDDNNCDIEWFHFDCVGIIMAPKGRWFCPTCRERNGDQLNNVIETNPIQH